MQQMDKKWKRFAIDAPLGPNGRSPIYVVAESAAKAVRRYMQVACNLRVPARIMQVNNHQVRAVDKQTDLHEQAQYLRKYYGDLRLMLEQGLPGGSSSLARGVILLACNVLVQGAETIEEHYGRQVMVTKGAE